MTIFSPKYCLTFFAFIFAFHVSAQNTILNQFDNGKLKINYQKNTASNAYEMRIIYKNDQVIYKEQSDSIILHNNNEFLDFKNNFQKVIESLADEKASAYFEKATYTLFKYDKGLTGVFVAIANPSGNIVISNNKQEASTIFSWIKSIDFGKD